MKSGSPSSRSRALIWWLTADCVMLSFCAARVNESASATSRKVLNCDSSIGYAFPEMWMNIVNPPDEHNALDAGAKACLSFRVEPARHEQGAHLTSRPSGRFQERVI